MIESLLLDHRGQLQCPLCCTWIQRTATGTLQDGVRAHYGAVHPREAVPGG